MISKALAAEMVIDWHRRICALSPNESLRKESIGAEAKTIVSIENDSAYPSAWYVQTKICNGIIDRGDGTLLGYNNTRRDDERYKGINRKRIPIITSRAEASEWAKRYAKLLNFPPAAPMTDLRMRYEGRRDAEGRSAGIVRADFECRTPKDIPYFWFQKLDGYKLFDYHPSGGVRIDPIDGVLFSMAQNWAFSFDPPTVRVTAKEAIDIATAFLRPLRKRHPFNAYEREWVPSAGKAISRRVVYDTLGAAHPTLFYKFMRRKQRGATLINGAMLSAEAIPNSELYKRPARMRLVWVVTFGPRGTQTQPDCGADINAATGEIMDWGMVKAMR